MEELNAEKAELESKVTELEKQNKSLEEKV
jgi:hypothetical protein